MDRRKVFVPVLIIATALLAACGGPSATATPTATLSLPTLPPANAGTPSTPTPTPTLVISDKAGAQPSATPLPTTTPLSGEMLLQEDFKGNSKSWDLAPSEQSTREIKDNKLQITIPVKGWMAWSNPGGSFSDFRLEVDATLMEDPSDGSYGVIFRYQNPNNFYMFDLSGEGHYSVNKMVNGAWKELVAPTRSDAVKKRGQTNRLGVVATGDRAEFYVNGTRLGEIQDSVFTSGDVALYGSTYEKAGVQVAFDNLTLYGKGTLKARQSAALPAATPRAEGESEIVKAQLDRGSEYYAKGAYDQAVAEFKAALSGAPGNAKAHYGLGLVYDRQGRRQEAIEEYLLAVRYDSGLADAYKCLGIDYHSAGEKDKALKMLETYLRLKPKAAISNADEKEEYTAVEEMADRLKKGIPVAPAGKGLVVVHNYTAKEATFTIVGKQYPVPGSDSVKGGGEIEIVLDPGQYTFSANQPAKELVHDTLILKAGDVFNVPLS